MDSATESNVVKIAVGRSRRSSMAASAVWQLVFQARRAAGAFAAQIDVARGQLLGRRQLGFETSQVGAGRFRAMRSKEGQPAVAVLAEGARRQLADVLERDRQQRGANAFHPAMAENHGDAGLLYLPQLIGGRGRRGHGHDSQPRHFLIDELQDDVALAVEIVVRLADEDLLCTRQAASWKLRCSDG